MALIEHGTKIVHWNLATSDSKPMSGISEGSTCHYVETGEVYMFHNGGWVRDRRLINALNGTNN